MGKYEIHMGTIITEDGCIKSTQIIEITKETFDFIEMFANIKVEHPSLIKTYIINDLEFQIHLRV